MSISRSLTVLTPSGIHARPAATLVTVAKQFESTLSLEKDGRTGNCKSLVSVLKLGVGHGATVLLTAHGPDESEAIEAIATMLTATPDLPVDVPE